MAATQQAKSTGSKWGFLSQAVSSLESGLDKMLAEDDDKLKKPLPRQIQAQVQSTDGTPRSSTEIKRNDRLQARLAQAMAKKETATVAASTDEVISFDDAKPSTSVESAPLTNGIISDHIKPVSVATTAAVIPTDDAGAADSLSVRNSSEITNGNNSFSVNRSSTHRSSGDLLRSSLQTSSRPSTTKASSEVDSKVLDIQLDHEKSIQQLRDEADAYLERIESLQRNLQELTANSIARAQDNRLDEDKDSIEKTIAEKDEKIALLIQEGMKLGKSELVLRNTIKKLRSENSLAMKESEAVKLRALKAENDSAAARSRLAEADTDRRSKENRISILSSSIADVDAIRKERDALRTTLDDMRADLAETRRTAEEARKQAERSRNEMQELMSLQRQEEIESAKIERDISESRLNKRIEDLQAELAQERAQAQAMEGEMLAEQATLESKLEASRIRAEEVSAGDKGDSQAKLLRQIEVMQNQYATASSNWQGIESTMLARITSVEQQRNESTGREEDVRRKLRDATKRQKESTRELEALQDKLSMVQNEALQSQTQYQKLVRRNEELEDSLAEVQKDLENQRLKFEKDIQKRMEDEKLKWHASLQPAKSESPVASMRRGVLPSFTDHTNSTSPYLTHSRRSSIHPQYDFVRNNSQASLRLNGNHVPSFPIPETPSIHEPDEDSLFISVPPTPASAHYDGSGGHHSHTVDDMISVSTAAAGPSVQLVERLSANIRKLESEKAVAKDELNRLQTQRDEARQQVVNFMRDLDSRKSNDEKLSSLEKAFAELETKYTTTLELLGEKTEQVEELRGDVEDVKELYRELADQMGRT